MLSHVLLINDRPGSLEVLDLFLTTHGFRVTAARSEREALLRAFEAPPDVVLTEVAGRDGAELAHKLRALPGLERTPIVALARGVSESDPRPAPAADEEGAFDEVLVRPSSGARIREALRRWVRRRRRISA